MPRPRIPDDRQAGCCKWIDFYPGFVEWYLKWFGERPTDGAWKAALGDWKRGNTGYEAAHNARRRAHMKPGPVTIDAATTRLLWLAENESAVPAKEE